MKTKLKWREWRGLHKIYEQGFSTAKITENPYIEHLIERGLLKTAPKNPQRILSTAKFRDYYQKKHLENYNYYEQFLSEYDLHNPTSNYTEDDIGALLIIKENCEGIKASEQTERGLSANLFEDSKYIEEHPGLRKAILKLLGLESFPGEDPKDNQYIFVVPCKTPKAIILCENIHFLRMPWQARKFNIVLWYAGGNNIAKLAHVSEIEYPIYYSCDWDYDGLSIYERIKAHIPKITLLYPSAVNSAKTINTQNHRSQWRINFPLSGLEENLYSQKEKMLIADLIKHNKWIEEESNSLVDLVSVNALHADAEIL